MFSFFRKKSKTTDDASPTVDATPPDAPPAESPAPPEARAAAPVEQTSTAARVEASVAAPVETSVEAPVEASAEAPRTAPQSDGWMGRLRQGLRKTGSGIGMVFTGARIDDALYDELESALIMADTGVKATALLLADLKRRVKAARTTDPAAVKGLLAEAIAALLLPLEAPLQIGATKPTVLMVVGVNGAGKTTTIGKLTRHLAEADQKVLLAAADTFRAAAREQLAVWANRNRVEIVSQAGGDPAAVTFDAVNAARSRGHDVVIADTAGRLPTQTHLMDELKKIKRVIGKAMPDAPHEVLLVVDGNTGQNALAQVQAFDAAIGLTGLVVTKLDGTAKGGVLAAIAGWSAESGRSIPVYFIGVGETLNDLQPFKAREFAQALLT